MPGVYLERLAYVRAEYLANREAVIAENVANANTPGYRARDLASFGEVLGASRAASGELAQVDVTNGAPLRDMVREIEAGDRGDSLSGNSVDVEREMSALADVNRSYALTSNVMRVYNQMLSAAAK